MTFEQIEIELTDMTDYPDHIILGVIKEDVEQLLDYDVREVAEYQVADEKTKKWLSEYWMEKYNYDIGDFEYEIKLRFVSISMTTGEAHETLYSFPSSIFSGFLAVKEDEEEDEEEESDERWGWL